MNAQNVSESVNQNALEQAERARIASERTALKKSLELQRQACYQKLAVTPCLNDARDEFNEKTRDLKRQEVALNDLRRKRAAAQRLADVDERNSPQAQLERAQRRGRAMEASAQREQSRAQRQADRAQSPVSEPVAAPMDSKQAAAVTPLPAGKPRSASPSHDAGKAAADRAARAEASRAQAQARESAAQERKAKALEREASRTKPPAASLPIPK